MHIGRYKGLGLPSAEKGNYPQVCRMIYMKYHQPFTTYSSWLFLQDSDVPSEAEEMHEDEDHEEEDNPLAASIRAFQQRMNQQGAARSSSQAGHNVM